MTINRAATISDPLPTFAAGASAWGDDGDEAMAAVNLPVSPHPSPPALARASAWGDDGDESMTGKTTVPISYRLPAAAAGVSVWRDDRDEGVTAVKSPIAPCPSQSALVGTLPWRDGGDETMTRKPVVIKSHPLPAAAAAASAWGDDGDEAMVAVKSPVSLRPSQSALVGASAWGDDGDESMTEKPAAPIPRRLPAVAAGVSAWRDDSDKTMTAVRSPVPHHASPPVCMEASAWGDDGDGSMARKPVVAVFHPPPAAVVGAAAWGDDGDENRTTAKSLVSHRLSPPPSVSASAWGDDEDENMSGKPTVTMSHPLPVSVAGASTCEDAGDESVSVKLPVSHRPLPPVCVGASVWGDDGEESMVAKSTVPISHPPPLAVVEASTWGDDGDDAMTAVKHGLSSSSLPPPLSPLGAGLPSSARRLGSRYSDDGGDNDVVVSHSSPVGGRQGESRVFPREGLTSWADEENDNTNDRINDTNGAAENAIADRYGGSDRGLWGPRPRRNHDDRRAGRHSMPFVLSSSMFDLPRHSTGGGTPIRDGVPRPLDLHRNFASSSSNRFRADQVRPSTPPGGALAATHRRLSTSGPNSRSTTPTEAGTPWPEDGCGHKSSLQEITSSPLHDEFEIAAAAESGNLLSGVRPLIDHRFIPSTTTDGGEKTTRRFRLGSNTGGKVGIYFRCMFARMHGALLKRRREAGRGRCDSNSGPHWFRRWQDKGDTSKGKGTSKDAGFAGVRAFTWWDNARKAPGFFARLCACIMAVCALWSTSLSVAGIYIFSSDIMSSKTPS